MPRTAHVACKNAPMEPQQALRVASRWTSGWGWRSFTAVEHWGFRRVCRLACLQARRPLQQRPSQPNRSSLHGACRAVSFGSNRLAGAARGLALRMDHGSQYLSDHFTNQIKFWGIQPSYAFVAEPQTNGVAERCQSHAEGTDHPWSHLPQHRGVAGRRPRLRRTLQCPVDRGEERLPEPRSSSSGVARRDLNQARRVRQTCVQGTGCAPN